MTIEEQIRASIHDVLDGVDFERIVWLTFYLSGQPHELRKLAETLNTRGWSNLDGCEGGFIYAKIATEKSEAKILALVQSAQNLCEEAGVEIINVDADSSPNVTESRFVTLYRT